MDLKNLSPSTKRLISGTAFLVVILGLIGYFVYWPRISKLKTLKSALAVTEDKIASQQAEIGPFTEKRTQLEHLKAVLNQLKAMFPKETEIANVMQDIVQLAREVNLEVTSIEPQPKINREIYQQIPIQINIRGEYQLLARFLDGINKLKALVTVNRFQIQSLESKAEVKNKKMSLSLTLNIFAYTWAH